MPLIAIYRDSFSILLPTTPYTPRLSHFCAPLLNSRKAEKASLRNFPRCCCRARKQASPPIDENSISPSKPESAKKDSSTKWKFMNIFCRFMSIFHFPVRLNANHNIQQVSSLLHLPDISFAKRNFEPEPAPHSHRRSFLTSNSVSLSFVSSTTLNGCEQRERFGAKRMKNWIEFNVIHQHSASEVFAV